ncbi:MAG: hypothetical protein AVDCRST_MAG20-2413 [uncultured Acidimicrobiales bacterium]|uniref:Uncharacterized protein n=1 Tax=uncultured Acidimicrobiales bacterium TaxID=310071 RepID=A0A6J4IMI9_9ACTN|nr:MAG: hypothetical protein AVDCRST_MAG20-2413 [uncultured Acidimicrobiales bacterium]
MSGFLDPENQKLMGTVAFPNLFSVEGLLAVLVVLPLTALLRRARRRRRRPEVA